MRASALILPLVLIACEGQVIQPTLKPPPPPPPPPEDPCAGRPAAVSAQPARRLSRREYLTTLSMLLPGVEPAQTTLPADASRVPFDTDYGARGVSEGLTDAWFINAERIAQTTPPDRYLPCALTAGAAACVERFIAEFGRAAFRRPLTEDERLSFRQVYDEASAAGQAPTDAVKVVLHALLVSPQLLFRLERSLGADGEIRPVDAVEYASRVSFFLTGAAPDAELLSAAEAGLLADAAGLAAQIERLSAGAAAHAQAGAFHRQWTHLDRLPGLARDGALFPTFEATRASMIYEADRFFETAFFTDGKLASLLTSRRRVVDDKLAALYGLSGAWSSAFAPVELPASERRGLLTLPALMAVTANPDRTSPTRRGHFVVSQLLCTEVPPPPADVTLKPPTGSTPTTLRERFAQHSANPQCASCHKLMDPPGFVLESYDAIGRFRTHDGEVAIDTRGTLQGTDVDGPIADALELSDRLANSSKVRGCFADQWLRFGLGKAPEADDQCSRSAVRGAFERSNGDFRALWAAILDSAAFRSIRLEGP